MTLTNVPVIPCGVVGGEEGGGGGDLGEGGIATGHAHARQVGEQALQGRVIEDHGAVDRGELLPGQRLGHPGRPQAHGPDPARAQLHRQVPHQRVHRRVRGPRTAHHRTAVRRAAVEGEDHAGAALGHAAGGGAGGDELGVDGGHDGPYEVVHGHVEQRHALYVAARDEVERDVDGVQRRDVRLHRRLVQGVEHRGLGVPARRRDVLGHHVERLRRTPHEVHAGALAGEGTGDGAADGSMRRRR